VTTLLHLTAYELRDHLRRVSTWVYFAVFFGLGFVLMAAAAGVWAGFDLGSPVTIANSPSRIANLTSIFSVLAVPVTAALAGHAAHRDFQAGIHPLFFTTPVRKPAYLGARYLGAVIANLLVLLGIPLGAATAASLPFADPDRIASYGAGAYALPFVLIVVPNVLATSALFLVMGALSRKFVAVQVGGLALLLGWSISRLFVNGLDFDWFTQLSDPFGLAPLNWAMRYWTVAESNGMPLPLTDALLLNRLLWMAVGGGVLAYGIAQFRFTQFASESGGRLPPEPTQAPSLAARLTLPQPHRSFGFAARAAQLGGVAHASFLRMVRGVWFWILAGMCVALGLVMGGQRGTIYGVEPHPVTYMMLEMVSGSFMLFIIVIVAVYAGELVWEEREARTAQIHDSMPVPNWVPFAGKALALTGMVAVLLFASMLTGMLIQAASGYFRMEPGLYLRELFGLRLPEFVLWIVFAMTVQSLANHKYVGHLIVILYFVLSPYLYSTSLSHNLYHYSASPETLYSDMNGYGHTLRPWAWYTAFWGGVAVLMAIASNLLWVRGQEAGGGWRMRMARARAKRPVLAAAALAFALVVGTGGFIVHNTTVLNEWETEDDAERIQALYEKQYKKFEALPQPRITDVRLEVDIHPASRDLAIRGVYRLVNRAGRPIDQVHVDIVNTITVDRLELGVPAQPIIRDKEKGYHAFRLARPLAPGDSTELRFRLRFVTRGFADQPSFHPVVQNGTFFDNQWLPGIGYNPEGELQDEGARERHGLAERPRVPAIGDPRALMRNDLSRDADWIRFAATVSTSPDQVAIAPGRLVREWRRGGRRFFRYEMEGPMLNFYSFLSARFTVRRDRWKGVNIEVFHHPGHEYNVARMIRSVKASLDYFTREFGPYQHRQVRIVEFPRYGDYAQSFAGTIPYSEGIGFIADVDADDIDYPYFVTAHEVAHQWWGHQAVGAHVQGSAMLTETLAEYSALMVMEKEYGREQIGRFLRYELDGYLKGRGMERRGEMPVALVEYQQYIHYNKGALAMYALRDYVGEQAVNGALRAFLAESRYRPNGPYPTSRDLLRHLHAATPDSLDGLVEDLFETVTLWDLSTSRAEGTQLPDGRYQVDFTVSARKMRAGGLGQEDDVRIDDWIEVGVFGADEDEPIYLKKFRFTGAPRTFRIVTDEWPRRAGIDPLHKLIDRELEDNVMSITRGRGSPAPTRSPARRDSAGAKAVEGAR
jgi:ABC-type transport system involved in multi-copper enzyme maturation permease subunit